MKINITAESNTRFFAAISIVSLNATRFYTFFIAQVLGEASMKNIIQNGAASNSITGLVKLKELSIIVYMGR